MRIYYSTEKSNNDLRCHYREKCHWINSINPANLDFYDDHENASTKPPISYTIDGTTYPVCKDCPKADLTLSEKIADIKVLIKGTN